ncbi:MAG: hypothetical protein RIR66_770 [Actinomycetota bacterium]
MAISKRLMHSRKLLVALIGAWIFSAISNPVSASAATLDAQIRISNIFVTQDLSTSRYVIRLTGQVENKGTAALSNVNIVLGTENQIVSKYALAKFFENRDSANLTQTNISAKLKRVAPNSKSDWQMTFFADDALSFSNGLYGVGVTAYTESRIDSDVVAIPLFTAPPTNVMNVSMAVQLSTLNYHLANGATTNSDSRELERLTNLIINARDLNITWVIDPSINQWLAELSNSDLKEQAAALTSMISEISGKYVASIYGQPDVSRMLASNRDDDLTNLIIRTQNLAGTNNIVLAPPAGKFSRDAIKTLGEQGVRPIITNTSITGDKYSSVQGTVVAGETNSLTQDESVLDCFKNNSDGIVEFQIRNCVLANLTLTSIDQIKNLVLLTPLDWSPSADQVRNLYSDLTGKSWLTTSLLSQILITPPATTYENLNDFGVEPFDLDFLEAGDSITTSSSKMASVFLDGNYLDSFTFARLRGFSSLWQTGDLATQFLSSNQDLLIGYQDKIVIEASRNITIPGSSTQIPITVANNSDRDISVVVQLISPQTSRFSSDPSPVIQVPSGKRVTVPMDIQLTGTGIFNLTAALYAPNGQPFGNTRMIQISSAEYQGLARTLVLVAFGLLLLLSISNIVKRSRGNKI